MRGSVVAAGIVGIGVGIIGTLCMTSNNNTAKAATTDRFQDFVMATGAVTIKPGVQTDGVWMLDYRTGKLLGTVIDRFQGRITGWAEVDLTQQFGVKPLQDVHFMMTTGYITQGQSALYVAETNTGKFGVFTMGPGQNGSGVIIRQHDMTSFRQVQGGNAPAPAAAPGTAPGAAPGATSGPTGPTIPGTPIINPGAPVTNPGAPVTNPGAATVPNSTGSGN